MANNSFDEALFYYRQARSIALGSGLSEDENKINAFINSTTIRKYKTQAEKYINAGNMLIEELNFSESLYNYKQARSIYIENNITDGMNR